MLTLDLLKNDQNHDKCFFRLMTHPLLFRLTLATSVPGQLLTSCGWCHGSFTVRRNIIISLIALHWIRGTSLQHEYLGALVFRGNLFLFYPSIECNRRLEIIQFPD